MNAPFLTQAAEGLPRRGFTNAEILRMVEVGVIDPDESFELIKGEIVPMPPELTPHFRARMNLVRVFMRELGEEWSIGTDGSLFLADDIEVKPDLHVFPGDMKVEDTRGPDVLLAVEVASTSQNRDFKLKLPIYAEHGVAELWILDLDAKRASIFRDPKDGAYQSRTDLDADQAFSPNAFPHVSVRLADLS